MTRNDYEYAIDRMMSHSDGTVPDWVWNALCDVFQADNPRFDRDRFMGRVRNIETDWE